MPLGYLIFSVLHYYHNQKELLCPRAKSVGAACDLLRNSAILQEASECAFGGRSPWAMFIKLKSRVLRKITPHTPPHKLCIMLRPILNILITRYLMMPNRSNIRGEVPGPTHIRSPIPFPCHTGHTVYPTTALLICPDQVLDAFEVRKRKGRGVMRCDMYVQ